MSIESDFLIPPDAGIKTAVGTDETAPRVYMRYLNQYEQRRSADRDAYAGRLILKRVLADDIEQSEVLAMSPHFYLPDSESVTTVLIPGAQVAHTMRSTSVHGIIGAKVIPSDRLIHAAAVYNNPAFAFVVPVTRSYIFENPTHA